MDATQVSNLLVDWAPIILSVFTFVVTASSILLKFVMTFLTKRKELDPEYKMGTIAMIIVSLLTALAQNSKSAANLSNQ